MNPIVSDSPSTSDTIRRRDQPMARRIPNSRYRSTSESSIVFITMTAPITIATTVAALSPAVIKR